MTVFVTASVAAPVSAEHPVILIASKRHTNPSVSPAIATAWRPALSAATVHRTPTTPATTRLAYPRRRPWPRPLPRPRRVERPLGPRARAVCVRAPSARRIRDRAREPGRWDFPPARALARARAWAIRFRAASRCWIARSFAA